MTERSWENRREAGLSEDGPCEGGARGTGEGRRALQATPGPAPGVKRSRSRGLGKAEGHIWLVVLAEVLTPSTRQQRLGVEATRGSGDERVTTLSYAEAPDVVRAATPVSLSARCGLCG